MYVTWYYCELHDLIKFLCALNKHIRTIYFQRLLELKNISNYVNVDNDDAAADDDDNDDYIYLIIIL